MFACTAVTSYFVSLTTAGPPPPSCRRCRPCRPTQHCCRAAPRWLRWCCSRASRRWLALRGRPATSRQTPGWTPGPARARQQVRGRYPPCLCTLRSAMFNSITIVVPEVGLGSSCHQSCVQVQYMLVAALQCLLRLPPHPQASPAPRSSGEPGPVPAWPLSQSRHGCSASARACCRQR